MYTRRLSNDEVVMLSKHKIDIEILDMSKDVFIRHKKDLQVLYDILNDIEKLFLNAKNKISEQEDERMINRTLEKISKIRSELNLVS